MENCWTRISRKNNFNFQPTFKANNITLKNRFSIFDTKGDEFQFSSGKESTREPKKVNKRNTEYIPTFMYTMKENSKVHRKKTFAKPTDINVYEISVMEKIKENVKLNTSLKTNVEDHIQTLKQRCTTVSRHANSQDVLRTVTTTDLHKDQLRESETDIPVGKKKSSITS